MSLLAGGGAVGAGVTDWAKTVPALNAKNGTSAVASEVPRVR
jgi:hypothetical protein